MKPANSAPVYAAMYAELAELCRSHGYALAIHGSLARDFDVVAIPWVKNPSEPQAVIDEITKKFAIEHITEIGHKEHGRIVYTLSVGFGTTALDFSFMPVVNPKKGFVVPTKLEKLFSGVEMREQYPRHDVAENEVLMSFLNDDDASAFREWWDEHGTYAFKKWFDKRTNK